MKRLVRWISASVYAIFVAFALSFGATQVFATTTASECPGQPYPPEFLGTCPPYDDFECNKECTWYGFQGGACLGTCCTCMT